MPTVFCFCFDKKKENIIELEIGGTQRRLLQATYPSERQSKESQTGARGKIPYGTQGNRGAEEEQCITYSLQHLETG
jgi:hypothetical protein